MTILVVGASGATGTHVVEQLLKEGHNVKIIVRSPDKLLESWKKNKRLQIISASLLDLSDQQLVTYTKDCNAIISCLGHTISWKGIYGQPRKLVTDAARRLTNAVEVNKPEKPIKFVLMNTTGNSNRDINEPISLAQKGVITLLRLLLPPHVDNEDAADFLRTKIGQNNKFVEWVAVRPDGLINEKEVTAYKAYVSPIRSAIFNPGKISRINVANFMMKLVLNDVLWEEWKGKMPVIYGKEYTV